MGHHTQLSPSCLCYVSVNKENIDDNTLSSQHRPVLSAILSWSIIVIPILMASRLFIASAMFDCYMRSDLTLQVAYFSQSSIDHTHNPSYPLYPLSLSFLEATSYYTEHFEP